MNREIKSMGMKNVLDHLKNCTPSSRSSSAVCGTESSSSSSSTVVRRVSGMKTLDSFVNRSGKRNQNAHS